MHAFVWASANTTEHTGGSSQTVATGSVSWAGVEACEASEVAPPSAAAPFFVLPALLPVPAVQTLHSLVGGVTFDTRPDSVDGDRPSPARAERRGRERSLSPGLPEQRGAMGLDVDELGGTRAVAGAAS